ncbi:MAG TPA: chromate transporter [Clostridiaceae bacterium]|nr:chromate transporter [Clostridiaceae bacterium]
MILLRLFIAFVEVGAFAFGGGYAALPLIERVIVHRYGWLSMMEMTDVVSISQVTPGPIAINAATFVGMRVAGLPGAIVASFATVLPQTILLFIIGIFFFRGKRPTTIDHAFLALRPGVAGLIGVATVSIFISAIFLSTSPIVIDPVALVAFSVVLILRIKRVNLFPLVFLGAGIGLLGHLVEYLTGTGASPR